MAARASFVMPRVSVRRASIDAEMIDFQSRERILAVVTSKQGRRIFSRRRGMKKKWGDVEAVLKSPPGGHVITLVKAYQGFRRDHVQPLATHACGCDCPICSIAIRHMNAREPGFRLSCRPLTS